MTNDQAPMTKCQVGCGMDRFCSPISLPREIYSSPFGPRESELCRGACTNAIIFCERFSISISRFASRGCSRFLILRHYAYYANYAFPEPLG